MDRLDVKILKLLQANGRMSNLELATKVGLSPTPCIRRVKRLEEQGIISGYRAEIEPRALGLEVTALVLLRLDSHERKAHDAFVEAAAKLPAITECLMTTGRLDYVIRVLARSLSHYESIIKDDLSHLPHIGEMETLFILSDAIAKRTVSLD